MRSLAGGCLNFTVIVQPGDDHMTEHVFLAWGRNQQLAMDVSNELRSAGYFPIVGGMQRGASVHSFFVNANVIQQMDNASIAIILVQKIYDSAGKPTQEFRPNLMFEWGYLQRRLRADAIHVFLIDILRSELPSDLLNAYTHEVAISNPSNPSQIELKDASKRIFNLFSKDISNIDLDGLEIIQKYDANRVALSEVAQGKRAFNPKEIGYTLLHMIQPSFYRNDLNFIKDCIRDFSRNSTGNFSNIIVLLEMIVKYYDTWDTINHSSKWSGSGRSSPEYRSFESIASTLQALAGLRNSVYNIFDVILNNFSGLAYFRMFEATREFNYLEDAIKYFELAREKCRDFKSIHPANEGFIRKFWESYIERNLSRVYSLSNDKMKAEQFGRSAEAARRITAAQLSAVGAVGLAKQFELETGLSRLDQAILKGSKEHDLTELFEIYIEPHNPRGIDRVWERLHSAVLKEAHKNGYKSLSKRLKNLLPKP
jgi:hypothetical protein